MPRVSDAKEKLTEAALGLIWTSGYGATSVDDICEKANVKKGSFYHFFKSKAELEVAALEAHWQRSKQRWNDLFSPTVPPFSGSMTTSISSSNGKRIFKKNMAPFWAVLSVASVLR